MSQNLAEIVHPLVDKGLFENAEDAVKNLMADYILHQVEKYQAIIRKFEKKYAMKYLQFNKYLEKRVINLSSDSSLHRIVMLEEEDALDWKIATEMLESWLSLNRVNKR